MTNHSPSETFDPWKNPPRAIRAGIPRPLSVHSLRHTFATRLYQKTGNLYLVQPAVAGWDTGR